MKFKVVSDKTIERAIVESSILGDMKSDKQKKEEEKLEKERLEKERLEKINKDKNNDNVNVGAQGGTNGSQGTQSSNTIKNNDNVGAQGGTNGAQGGTNGAQGGTSGAQGGTNGAQSAQNNTVKKNDIDFKSIEKYSSSPKNVTIKDFGGINGAQGAQTKISPATYSTNQRQTRELVSTGKLKDTDLNKYSRSNIYTADDGKTQVTRSTVNTIAQFDMGPNIKKGDKLGVIPNSLRKKYDLKASSFKEEAYEPYHIVLGYVLSEGHAETVEEAHYVMGQMDSETIQEIVALDEAGVANKIMTGAALTLGGLGLNAIRKMLQNKKKMDNDGKFTPNSTMDNIQKKNKMLDDFKSGNY